jgi:hypothetical protein
MSEPKDRRESAWNPKRLVREHPIAFGVGGGIALVGFAATVGLLDFAAAPLRGRDLTLVAALWILFAVVAARMLAGRPVAAVPAETWLTLTVLCLVVLFTFASRQDFPSKTETPAPSPATPTGSSEPGAPDVADPAPTTPPSQSTKDPVRDSARDFLVSGSREALGFGLYSYVLFGSRPSAAERDHHLAVISAYLNMLGEIREYLRDIAAPMLRELNITSR